MALRQFLVGAGDGRWVSQGRRGRDFAQFINVRKVLRTRAFISFGADQPLVDARQHFTVSNLIRDKSDDFFHPGRSHEASCHTRFVGPFPRTLLSICSVKWSRQRFAGRAIRHRSLAIRVHRMQLAWHISVNSQVINCSQSFFFFCVCVKKPPPWKAMRRQQPGPWGENIDREARKRSPLVFKQFAWLLRPSIRFRRPLSRLSWQ